MATLVRSVMLGMKHAAPIMMKQGSGSIINNGSVAGRRAGYSTSMIYGAAKAAVNHLTVCAAMQLGEKDVRCNSISPGGIATGIFAKALGLPPDKADSYAEAMKASMAKNQPIPRAGIPDDIAHAAVFLASDDSTFINGHDLVVDGGLVGGRMWTSAPGRREGDAPGVRGGRSLGAGCATGSTVSCRQYRREGIGAGTMQMPWKAGALSAIALLTASAAKTESSTQCTGLGFCYCVNAEIRPTIDRHVADIRKTIRSQRELGKAIGYISIPITTVEGSYAGVNVDAAGDVSARLAARLGSSFVWTLNPGAKDWSLPANATGADYMFMWTRVLEGADGSGADFDFVYFVGPSDFARLLKLDGTAEMQKLEAYYDKRAADDPGLAKVEKRAFRDYYALRASVAFSLGAHDEWNIAKAINDRRRARDGSTGIPSQLAILFDGQAVPPGSYEGTVQPGDTGACSAR